MFVVRCLPIGSDEWVAFDKWDSFVEARMAREILRKSKRFKGVEIMPKKSIIAMEGVDALVLAEVQIAGAWAPAEQRAVRERASKRKVTLSQSSEKNNDAIRRAKAKWIQEAFDELVCIVGDLIDADPDLLGKGKEQLIGLPKISVDRIRKGERTAYGVFVSTMSRDYATHISIRFPRPHGDDYYFRRLESIAVERNMSHPSLFVSMLELWDAAPESRRLAAISAVETRGVTIRARSQMNRKKVAK